jgi:pheromone a factor receptor
MRHPGYPICATLGLVAVLLPSPWHWRAKNISTLGLIFWLSLTNLTIVINTSLWADNIVDRSPGWCDICRLTALVKTVYALTSY